MKATYIKPQTIEITLLPGADLLNSPLGGQSHNPVDDKGDRSDIDFSRGKSPVTGKRLWEDLKED